jgi:hypothetical protein
LGYPGLGLILDLELEISFEEPDLEQDSFHFSCRTRPALITYQNWNWSFLTKVKNHQTLVFTCGANWIPYTKMVKLAGCSKTL